MPRWAIATAVAAMLGAGCAMTLEDRLTTEIYWDAGRECEAQYHTLSMVRVQRDGGLTLTAAAESSSERAAFTACYWRAIRARVDRRQLAGQPLPPDFKLEPDVDLD